MNIPATPQHTVRITALDHIQNAETGQEIPQYMTDSFSTYVDVTVEYPMGTLFLSLDDQKVYIKKSTFTGIVSDWAVFGK